MLFSKKNNTDADDFWKRREEELGMPVRGKTLARVIHKQGPTPLWGLLYTTSDAIYFQTFESEAWMSRLFVTRKNSSRTRNQTIKIMTTDIEHFRVIAPKKRFFKFFQESPLIDLTWRSREKGSQETMIFETNDKPENFIATLPR